MIKSKTQKEIIRKLMYLLRKLKRNNKFPINLNAIICIISQEDKNHIYIHMMKKEILLIKELKFHLYEGMKRKKQKYDFDKCHDKYETVKHNFSNCNCIIIG